MPYSVPFACGHPLPLTVLESIAFHLVTAPAPVPPAPGQPLSHPYLYGPPPHLPLCLPLGIARLPAFLSVSKSVYEALSPGVASSKTNGERYPLQTELYARLYCTFLDAKAVGRRWCHRRGDGPTHSPAQRRRIPLDDDDDGNGGEWDKDVRGVTNAGLTAQLVQVCKVLKFYRRGAKEMGIPLPAQAEYPRQRKNPNTLASMYDPELERMLLVTFMMMMEDDGLNHHQLRLVSAPLFVDMLMFHRLNEGTGEGINSTGGIGHTDVRYNDGWPVENVLNSTAVWLLWMFTTQEKIESESLPVRERIVKLVLPFVFCPYRYASALVPPTHFTLPLAGDLFHKPLSTSTAHGSFPVYHSFPSTPAAASTSPASQVDATRLVTEPVQEDSTHQNEPAEPQPSRSAPATLPSLGGTPESPSNPTSAPPSPVIMTVPQRPPPTQSNSQAHPSYGVTVPWYYTPFEEADGSTPGVLHHLDHLEEVTFSPPTTARASIIPRPTSELRDAGIVIHLPLITAAAKLVFMSRREAVPLPVLAQLPVDREAAIRSGWRWAGPTQADMREMGGWCSWGRRKMPPSNTPGSTGATETVTADTSPDDGDNNNNDAVGSGSAEKVRSGDDEKLPWYLDSRKWDVDWWRMRLCGGREWQQKVKQGDLAVIYKRPKESLAWRMGKVYEKGMLTGLWQGYMHMPNEPSLRYVATTRQYPNNFSESALGVTMRPILMRLEEHIWVPTPLDPGRFGERKFTSFPSSSSRGSSAARKSGGTKPKKTRFEAGGRSMKYWEKDLSTRQDDGENAYEYVVPKGPGPVPVAKATTMTKFVVEHPGVEHEQDQDDSRDGDSELEDSEDEDDESAMSSVDEAQEGTRPIARPRVGFLDENMNNAWLPGPVGKLEWEGGTRTAGGGTGTAAATASGAAASPESGASAYLGGALNYSNAPSERGIDEGVWRDRFVDGGVSMSGLRMKSMTFVVPSRLSSSTFHYHYSGGEERIVAAAAAHEASVVASNVDANVAARASPAAQGRAGSALFLVTTRINNHNAPLAPPPQPDQAEIAEPNGADKDRRPAVVVQGTNHVYETFDASGERESVHERMERARGAEVCRGVRWRRRGRARGGALDGVEEKKSGGYEYYAYPHPGCLRCREREGVEEARRRRIKERKGSLDRMRSKVAEEAQGSKGDNGQNVDAEALFTSVGLGRSMMSSGFDTEDDEEGTPSVIEIDFGNGVEERGDHDDDDDSEEEWVDYGDPLKATNPSSCPDGAEDVILTGGMDERHAQAWGAFKYYGRVRPWDGLVGILRIGMQQGNTGSQFFYGYVYGGRSFVGNWRFAATDAVSPTMESSFVLSRRGE